MKLKDNLILRKVANQYVIVPVGNRVREIDSTVYISSSAAFLWDHMKEHPFTKEELVDLIMKRYSGVTREVAAKDIASFLDVLRKNNILEREPGDPLPQGGSVRVVIRNDSDT